MTIRKISYRERCFVTMLNNYIVKRAEQILMTRRVCDPHLRPLIVTHRATRRLLVIRRAFRMNIIDNSFLQLDKQQTLTIFTPLLSIFQQILQRCCKLNKIFFKFVFTRGKCFSLLTSKCFLQNPSRLNLAKRKAFLIG